MKKIAFKTLGCRLNQYETDALVSQFATNGYEIVDFSKNADIVVINTCTVTDQSDQKSNQMIRQATRRHRGEFIFLTGFLFNNYRKSLKHDPDNLTWFVDNEHKSDIFSLVDGHYNGEIIHPEQGNSGLFGYPPASKTLHTRSWIKIQDGCDNFCTFCIVPKVRGRAVSRPYEDILDNIKQVVGFGFKEVVLTGVNIARYSYDNVDFENLIEKVLNLHEDFRLRIGSIEPDGFGDKLISLFEHPKLTPHLHLCLQSGSDEILLKMRRMYAVTDFLNIVDKIRKRYPLFNFTTDLIVGFPSETEDDFNKTIEVCRQIGFGHIHTFKYSVRKGTRAEKMPDQIAENVKVERSEKIRDLSVELKHNYRKQWLGKTQNVLVEKNLFGTSYGYGENYLPVKFKDRGRLTNNFAAVKITNIEPNGDEPALIGIKTDF
jgi:threonylcarbamoyladenosine tRNA methylthiotransferase MtaB